MKRVLTIATAIILATTSTAFAGNHDNPVNKTTSYESSFTKIQVEDGIDILLVESADKSIEFEGDEAAIAKVDWKIKDGVMHISSKKGSLRGKVKLIVNVNNLRELSVKDGSEVMSYGQLKSASLRIFLDGDAFISVKSSGNITLSNTGDTDLEVRRVEGNVKFE
ncbi:MAG: DUF2807 domain-containing protein [Bacteroidota bacterium]